MHSKAARTMGRMSSQTYVRILCAALAINTSSRDEHNLHERCDPMLLAGIDDDIATLKTRSCIHHNLVEHYRLDLLCSDD
jgi:hypothetical protein